MKKIVSFNIINMKNYLENFRQISAKYNYDTSNQLADVKR